MTHYFLALQYTYESIEIALYRYLDKQQDSLTSLHFSQEHKFEALKTTIPIIQKILQLHQLKLNDLQFIAINNGPGPYNTLRALLTMINGIKFGFDIPLISLSALDLLLDEQVNENKIALLHAFLGNVFYKIKTDSFEQKGACSLEKFIQKINTLNQEFLIVGNGAIMHKTLLDEKLKLPIFPYPIPEFNSLQTLANQALKKYLSTDLKEFSNYLEPIYFEDLKVN